MQPSPTTKTISDLFEDIRRQPVAPACPATAKNITRVFGGDINHSFHIETSDSDYFLKINRADQLDMFASEAEGLAALKDALSIHTCDPIRCGQWREYSYLLLSYEPIDNNGNWFEAGQQLARLHQQAAGSQFGFGRDTYCGTNLQINQWHNHWPTFFAQRRIGYQLQLLGHHNDRQIQEIVEAIEALLNRYHASPSLVHGDLWSGNIGFSMGKPIIFDPAAYIGDADTDLAMTELFGALPQDFYQGYQSIRPIAEGYPLRRQIYQLYHLLNHANLFGGGYLAQATQSIHQLLKTNL